MKEVLRAVDAANTAKMTRQALPSATIVLVEGGDDQAFLQKFTNRTACRIVVAHGRPYVVQALDILRNDGLVGVLGMIDADFDRLLHQVQHDPDIVQTDAHDVEMLLLSSPALDSLLVEYATANQIAEFCAQDGVSVLSRLLRPASAIGRIRLLSCVKGLSFCFDNLNLERFISEKTLALDEDMFLRSVQEQSRVGVIDAEEFFQTLADDRYEAQDLLHICCGHDVVLLLALALRRLLGKNNPAEVSAVRLERALRLAYERTFFVATALFEDIRRWESRNSPWIVFSADL